MHGKQAEIGNKEPIETWENTVNIYHNMMQTGFYVQKELQRLADYNKKIFETTQEVFHDHHDKINDALFDQHTEIGEALETHQKDIGNALTQHQRDIGNLLITRLDRVEGTLMMQFFPQKHEISGC